ncbi:MAG TPA: ABC transporter substrate-binding protein [Steroidobacteraceae bacterium]|nr:ABC transporter substrate-binding protein [Steroidobacteraceae bacterium]
MPSLSAGPVPLLALLCACAHAATAASATAQSTLRVGVSGLPASLGNPFKGNGRPGTLVWYAIFDGLTQLDEHGRLVPALALSWELAEPTLWRFQLRPDVRFSNGRPFDAAAAVAVLEWLASKDGRATVIGNELRGVVQARAAGPLTLEVRTRDPDPILPKRMVGALMVEPGAWSALGPDRFALAPAGTGPYVLTQWDQRRRRAQARANPYGWRRVALEGLEYVELPNAAVRTQALLSRDIDIAAVEIEELDRLEDRGFPIVSAPSMSVMSLVFITERATPGPLQDVRVRQALNYAVDKETIARTLLRGFAPASGQPAPRISFGHDPGLRPYPYDPARARALLAQAGYPNGFPLRAQIITNSFPADGLIYEAVAHYLRQVRVEATLEVITFPQYLRHLQRNSFTGDAFGSMWNSAPYNDATRPMESVSCRRPRPFFCDRALADQLERTMRILPEQERLAAMRSLARAYHQAAPALFLVEQVDLYAHHPELRNVRLRNRVPVYEDMRRGK